MFGLVLYLYVKFHCIFYLVFCLVFYHVLSSHDCVYSLHAPPLSFFTFLFIRPFGLGGGAGEYVLKRLSYLYFNPLQFRLDTLLVLYSGAEAGWLTQIRSQLITIYLDITGCTNVQWAVHTQLLL